MSVRPLCGLLVAVIVGGGAEAALAQFDKAVELKKLLEKNDYKVELSSERLSATHAQWLNMTIRSYKGGLLLRAWLETTEYKTDDLETLANKLNYGATATRIYIATRMT